MKEKVRAKLEAKAMSKQNRDQLKDKFKKDFGVGLYDGAESKIGYDEDYSSGENADFWDSFMHQSHAQIQNSNALY